MSKSFTHTFLFDVGEYVEDITTGVKGPIMCRTSYFTGCNRYSVQPPVKKDGTVPDWHSIDENAVKRVPNKRKLKALVTAEDKDGGPKPPPARPR